MDKEDEKETGLTGDKAILALARERFTAAAENENRIRVDALEDLRFRAGDQWDEAIAKQRAVDQRPCLTINRLPQFIRQITNDQRQNRPAIEVSPVDDGGDVDTAKIIQGVIRHIEQDSNADAAYDTAFMSAVTHGFGYFRLVTEYEAPDSFDQCIKFKRVRNPFTVYMDPSYQEADGSDAGWGFVVEDYSKDEYKAKWPKSKLAGMSDWSSTGDSPADWVTKDGCRIAEYFYKEYKQRTLVKLSNGVVDFKDELPSVEELAKDNLTIIAERDVPHPVVKWCIINGIEILETTEWLGRWIPIIPVLGDELDIDGEKKLEGIVRHAKDPQRMYNYWASAETETIALAPRAPYIGAEGQFEGKEEQWRQANVKNFAYLEYKPKTLNGDALPPPQRNTYEPPVQAITQARMQANDDLKATTGIYDPSLGNRSNERSGKAILARQNQAHVGNFHFVDNLARAIKYAGRQLVDLIPRVYDTPRVLRIIGDDGAPSTVKVNQKPSDGQPLYDLTVGRYDVVVSSGPSYATKRQQAVEAMLDLSQSYPAIVQLAGDLMVKNMDWPGAREISERLRKALPPGVAEPKPGEQGQAIPPQVQQQMEQMGQMVDALTQQLNAAKDELQSKSNEIASKERIAVAEIQSSEYKKAMELRTQERIAGIQTTMDAQVQLEKVDADQAKHALGVAHERDQADKDRQHEKELAAAAPKPAPA